MNDTNESRIPSGSALLHRLVGRCVEAGDDDAALPLVVSIPLLAAATYEQAQEQADLWCELNTQVGDDRKRREYTHEQLLKWQWRADELSGWIVSI